MQSTNVIRCISFTLYSPVSNGGQKNNYD